MAIPFGESAYDELLSKAGSDPLCGTDCEIAEHKADPSVCLRIVKIREGGRREISSDARVVRLPSSVIASRNKRAEHRMADSRTGRASPLVKVTRILMKQGRQYGAANHNVRETIGRGYANALAVRPPPLTVVEIP